MFYLMTHTTHFYGYIVNGIGHIEGRKEENILCNDALNTLYLQLYGIRHMVKNHSDS